MRGKPTSPGGLGEFGVGRSGRAGGDGHVVGEGEVAGGDLVAEERQGLGGGSDEDKPGIGAGPGEVGAFAEEAVSGVDGLASLRPGGGDDGLDVEVGVSGGVAFEEHDLVGEAGGEAVAVGHGSGEHGADAQAPQRADDAHGDLAAVRHEDGLEHGRHCRGGGVRYMRKTPQSVAGMGALRAAEMPMERTRRVSRGSMTPSSQRRALLK